MTPSSSASAADPAIVEIVHRVRGSLDALVESSVERTWAEVPAYRASPDERVREDLRQHVDVVFRAVLDTLLEGRGARPSDFPHTAAHATRRVQQGVGLADFLRAFRLNQESLWNGVVAACGSDPALREAALAQAAHVMQVMEVGASLAAQSYVEAQQLRLAEGDRLRRDLFEDLLTGVDPAPGPRRLLLREVGLESATRLIVASAVPVTRLGEGQSLREALVGLRSAFGTGYEGLAVVRRDEIVGVSPVVGPVAAVVERMVQAQAQLAKAGLGLSLGISTVHHGTAAVAEAYAEACVARDGLAGASGVSALPVMSAFDYLVRRPDATARRLVRPAVRAFIEEDRRRGGVLVETLLAYVEADLNATATAERLHAHVNTVYYRLERIAERSGCDVRRVVDVQELLIGVRLLEHVATPQDPL